MERMVVGFGAGPFPDDLPRVMREWFELRPTAWSVSKQLVYGTLGISVLLLLFMSLMAKGIEYTAKEQCTLQYKNRTLLVKQSTAKANRNPVHVIPVQTTATCDCLACLGISIFQFCKGFNDIKRKRQSIWLMTLRKGGRSWGQLRIWILP